MKPDISIGGGKIRPLRYLPLARRGLVLSLGGFGAIVAGATLPFGFLFFGGIAASVAGIAMGLSAALRQRRSIRMLRNRPLWTIPLEGEKAPTDEEYDAAPKDLLEVDGPDFTWKHEVAASRVGKEYLSAIWRHEGRYYKAIANRRYIVEGIDGCNVTSQAPHENGGIAFWCRCGFVTDSTEGVLEHSRECFAKGHLERQGEMRHDGR